MIPGVSRADGRRLRRVRARRSATASPSRRAAASTRRAARPTRARANTALYEAYQGTASLDGHGHAPRRQGAPGLAARGLRDRGRRGARRPRARGHRALPGPAAHGHRLGRATPTSPRAATRRSTPRRPSRAPASASRRPSTASRVADYVTVYDQARRAHGARGHERRGPLLRQRGRDAHRGRARLEPAHRLRAGLRLGRRVLRPRRPGRRPRARHRPRAPSRRCRRCAAGCPPATTTGASSARSRASSPPTRTAWTSRSTRRATPGLGRDERDGRDSGRDACA